MNTAKKERLAISVVVPVYNSEGCLEPLLCRLTEVLRRLKRSYEIILVNDYSSDGSWWKICVLKKSYPELYGINLRINCGQDNAIMAGLGRSRGDIVIIMDDDLQHDPEAVPLIVETIEKGFDVCYVFFDKKMQTRFKNFGSWFNDKVANCVLNKPKEIYLSPYKALNNDIVNEIVKYEGPYPYVDGLLMRVTRNVAQIEYKHLSRYAGKGNYNLRRSVSVWLKLATSFSLLPLRLATMAGFLFSSIGLCLAIIFILLTVTGMEAPSGWASTIVAVLVLGGVQLTALGIIGEYIGRIYLFANRKPQYVIKEII